MAGLIAWCVLLGACLAVEVVALRRPDLGWPTLSDLARVVTSSVMGRALLFALWLWLGWHLFVRGWAFPLLAPLGRADEGPWRSAAAVEGAEIVAMLLSFGLLVVVLLRGRNGRHRGPGATAPPDRSSLRRLAVTVATGYAAFVGLVAVLGALLPGSARDLVRSALSGGAVLALGVVTPGALLLWRATARARGADHARGSPREVKAR